MFSGHLDPRAQEFRPRSPSLQNQITLLQPHIYYPYPSSLYPSTGVQVLPFYDVSVGYQPSQSTAYVRLSGAPLPPPPPPPPPQLPPPSPTATRALLLSSVPTDVTESTVRRELEVLGEIRAIEMESLQDGIVTVHFYDLRHAEAAMMAIREQHMQQQRRMRHLYNAVLRRTWSGFESENLALTVPVPSPGSGLIAGQAVWAQFMLPTVIPVSDGHNQGTLVVFNLDSGVSACKLREIFEAFGPVKELRETPSKQHQRFVEFFDIRDAARAIKEMEGKEIHGKRVLIEFSRPGGNRRRFSNTVTTYSNLNSLNTTTNNNCRSNYYSRITNYSISPPPPILPPKSFRRSTSDASSSNSSLIPQPSSKKSSFIRGNGTFNNTKRLNCGGTMGALSMSIVGNLKNNNCASATKQQQQQGKLRNNSRSWKGNRNKNSDSHFLIKEDEMMEESKCIKDTRTTVMIKNIPNKYSQKLLLNMLDNHCNHCNQQIADGDDDHPLSSYDFVYLPIDFNNKCNVGYGFVNLTSPQATWRFYKAFHLQRWEVFNSRKICEVTYARLQGLEVLMEHFKNSKFACETDEYLPVMFSPPRDGKQLTDPMAIGGHTNAINKKLVIDSGGGFDGDDDDVEDEMDGQDWLHGCDDDEDEDEDDDDDDGESSNGGDVNDDEDGVPRVPKDQLE